MIRNQILKYYKPLKPYHISWITDFPLFELSDKNEIKSSHHPFTSPITTDIEQLKSQNLLDILSRSYDLVINGYEVGGGSIRIHNYDLQMWILKDCLKLSQIEIDV